MTREPAISVVMGVYNGAKYLPETVESVLCQSEADLEFIIVNDGSTDAAVDEVLADYARHDARLRVITKANEGLTKALIDGCAAAKGTYIARIDNGDVMMPERLEKQREVLDAQPGVVFVSCWTEYCGPEWEPLHTHRAQTAIDGVNIFPTQPHQYPTCGPTHHGSVMFRRKVYESVGGYRAEFYYGQDWDLWYRLAEAGLFYVCPEILYRARYLLGSISGENRFLQERIGLCSLEAYWHRQQGKSESEILQQAASIRTDLHEKMFWRARGEGAHFIAEQLRRHGDIRCRRYFRQSLKQNPFRLNTWCRLLKSFSLGAV